MNAAITHRGPDDEGIYRDDQAMLGMRRLSIIDLAGGHQPVHNEDGSVQAVFNGEIYNFRELRGELEARGHRFYTRSDTEVIVHGYEEWGDDGFARLDGMFGIALWDTRSRALILARDRFGEKPLFYSLQAGETGGAGGRLLFASELKSLLVGPGIQARDRPRGGARLRLLRLRPHAGQHLPGRPQAAARALAAFRRRAARRSGATTASSSSPSTSSTSTRPRSSWPPARRGGEEPARLRRSVRRVPERGPRLERRGRAHGAAPADSRVRTFSHRLPRVSLQRALRRASRGESPRNRAPRADRQTRTPSSSCSSWSGISTSLSPTLRPCRPTSWPSSRASTSRWCSRATAATRRSPATIATCVSWRWSALARSSRRRRPRRGRRAIRSRVARLSPAAHRRAAAAAVPGELPLRRGADPRRRRRSHSGRRRPRRRRGALRRARRGGAARSRLFTRSIAASRSTSPAICPTTSS